MRRGARIHVDPKSGFVLEAAREEETLRYGASLLAGSVLNDSAVPLDPSQISVSSDAGLAAYAQLAALRLNAHTCMVSLFDGRRQHIVAEAKQSTAIELGHGANLVRDANGCPLLLSGTAVPREHLACEQVLDLLAVVSEEGKLLPVAVVPDLTQDARFSSKPYFGPTSSLGRFYAGVPLRSPHGIDIGVICIFGSEPRDSFDAPSQRFLRHLSSLVMSHLHSMVSAASYRRNERMVRGLGSMVEGLGSMSKPRHTPNPLSFQDVEGKAGALKEGTLNAKQQRIQGGSISSPPPAPVRPVATPLQSMKDFGDHLEEAHHVDSTETLDSGTERVDHVQSTNTSPKTEDDENTVALKSLFSRAANIIRESVEVEGALFLDGSIAAFGRLVPRNNEETSQSRSASSGEESLPSDEGSLRPVICRVLGFSNSDTSSIDSDKASEEHLSVPDSFLDRISRRYPDGQIINFGDAGEVIWAISDSEGSDASNMVSPSSGGDDQDRALQKRIRQRPRKSDGAYLMRMFPGARSVALVPLWDSHKSRWFAGGFVWTRSRARVFAPGELSYLKAFGSSVMAEVARMEVLRESKAKEDVLGSLSHEIRSPLHGVILGVELLHDSGVLSGFQEDVLYTVETCGRTLLDTLDHLLDFSKVNHFLQKPKRRAAEGKTRGLGLESLGPSPIEAGMMSLFSNVRLDLLTEEVIESVYVGFSFQDTSSQWETRERADSSYFERAGTLRRLESVRRLDSVQDFAEASPPRTSVSIHLHIDPKVHDWAFHAQSGALRRILMNIFGNAMKYTSRGHIFVSLTQEPSSLRKRSRLRNIVLSVSDSGRGISNDYLQNRLFTPFAQENQLSSGVGLGLSLVKQIVHGLGGRIAVESQINRGTTVRVRIPLRLTNPRNSPTNAPQGLDSNFQKLLEKLKGVRVSLLGFPEEYGEQKPLSVHVEAGDARLSPRSVLEVLCRRLLHMVVVSEVEAASDPHSLFLCTEHAMQRVPVFNGRSIPAVVICDSVFSSHQHQTQSSAQPSAIREFVSQPVGPRKLARILVFVLERTKRQDIHELDGQALSPNTLSDLPKTAMKGLTGSYFDQPEITEKGIVNGQSSVLPQRACVPPLAVIAGKNGSITNDTISPDLFEIAPPAGPEHEEKEARTLEESVPFLLVDDNAINLKILSAYMRKLDRGFDCATDGLQALLACRVRTVNYRCIFMDISMPIMDGLESTRLIRAHERQHELKPALIIALTGLASSKTQQEAYGSGVDLFLSKPVPLKELGGILQSRGLLKTD
ncbi:unnamed protein product [Discula destructiva]